MYKTNLLHYIIGTNGTFLINLNAQNVRQHQSNQRFQSQLSFDFSVNKIKRTFYLSLSWNGMFEISIYATNGELFFQEQDIDPDMLGYHLSLI
jgi:hypothetical protein